ncbi:flippase [Parazoarcus communis]|uniref:Flippase n=1 Tax=Parazoarcus communis SWub3 = DSM 12120 TaxID=1121029 RepID=A0A323UV12_9RHOO|nr:flippase [Parazoarcus communis]NMG72713.1 oligosaccharide flippase family protein [Parazoarcus communis SWub3 = DSM 12120]PZA15086.1 flippase [Azoarcus communis] [Parazoarcus communis SWub3 = DSM 12120]
MRLIPVFILRRIADRQGLVQVVDNIGWLFFDKILRLGVGLLVAVWIARYLGPSGFGLINFALALTSVFSAVAGLGLHGIVVRDLIRDPGGARLTLGSAVLLQVISGFLAYVLMLGVSAYLRPDDALFRCVTAIIGGMILFKACEVAAFRFESKLQSKYTVLVQGGVFVLFSGMKVGLILHDAPLIAFAWAMFAETALTGIALLTVMSRIDLRLKTLMASHDRVRSLLMDGWPLAISALAMILNMRIDQVMLGELIGNEAVGVYAASVRVAEAWYFIPLAVIASVFPSVSHARDCNRRLYHVRLKLLHDSVAALALSVALVTMCIARPLMALLYGKEFEAGGEVLAVLAWCGVFASLGFASGRWYVLEDLQRLALLRNLFGVAINVVMNALLIPLHGPLGAAVSTLIALWCATVLFDAFDKRTRDIFLMKLEALLLIGLFRRWFSR